MDQNKRKTHCNKNSKHCVNKINDFFASDLCARDALICLLWMRVAQPIPYASVRWSANAYYDALLIPHVTYAYG
eukprot:6455285-Amphidinium_carterae.2